MMEISDMDQILPPELLTNIFRFLPYSDLKNAMLVCRCVKGYNSLLVKRPKTKARLHRSYLFRYWREVGERGSLWSNFKLDFSDGNTNRQLLQVLCLRRLKSLQHISLECVQDSSLLCLLQIIIDNCLGIRKLSLRMDVLQSQIPEDQVAPLAEALVRFEEVDLTEFCITSTDESALLGAAITASSNTKSRLRILKIHGHRKSHSKAVAEAKGKIRIGIKYGSRHAKWQYS